MSEQSGKRKRVMKSAPKVSGSMPFSPDAVRHHLLEQAGFDEKKQVSLVKKVVDGIERDVDAVKTEVLITREGTIHEVVVPDNVARSKARDQALDLVGVRAPRTNATQTVRHVVSIEWPDFARPAEPKVIDVDPKQLE